MLRFLPAFVLAISLFSPLLRSEIEFSGYLLTTKTAWFVLTDSEKTLPGSALTLKQSYQGYVLTRYDSHTDELRLEKEGGTGELRLKPSATAKRIILSGRIEIEGEGALEVLRASLAFGEHSRFPLKEGLVFSIRPTEAPDGSMKYGIMVEKSSGGRNDVLAGPLVRVAAGKPFSGKVGGVLFNLAPQGL